MKPKFQDTGMCYGEIGKEAGLDYSLADLADTADIAEAGPYRKEGKG